MYGALARWLVRRSLRFHQARDVEGLLTSYADDVRFFFPGRNSWGGEYRGKEQLRAWLERFYKVGLNLHVEEILVKGPPWNTSVCIVFTDDARDADGSIVYENRGVIYGHAAWGKIKRYEVFEDTEKTADFDKYLAVHEPAASQS
jgi:ketosteroid isomerase-like protein